MGKNRLSIGAAELLKLAAHQIEVRDCQGRGGCRHYNVERGAMCCPSLNPRDNGEVCCYGWQPIEGGEA